MRTAAVEDSWSVDPATLNVVLLDPMSGARLQCDPSRRRHVDAQAERPSASAIRDHSPA
jgi:hypothetical protein